MIRFTEDAKSSLICNFIPYYGTLTKTVIMKAKEDLTKIRFAANLTAKKIKEKKVEEGKHRFLCLILFLFSSLLLLEL